MKLHVFSVAVAMAACLCAETRTWLENAGGSWNEPSNWSGGTVPTSRDTADLSILTGSKTLSLASNSTVSNIVYNPVVGASTNVLSIAGDGKTLTLLEYLTIGSKARLETSAAILSSGVKSRLYKTGAGEWRVRGRYASNSSTAQRYLYHEEGLITFASGAEVKNIRFWPASDVPDAQCDIVFEEGSSFDAASKMDNWEPSYKENSHSKITINGGTLDFKTATNDGCFINSVTASSYTELNINGGLVDGSAKTLWVSFRGTSVVNQTGGVMRWKTINLARNGENAVRTIYNFSGGEIWLTGGNLSRQSMNKDSFTAGNAKFKICANSTMDFTSPMTVTGNLTIEVTNSTYTCNLPCRIPGAGGITKTGPGVLNMYSGEKQFTGPLTVSNGTLIANAKFNGGGPLEIADGGILALDSSKSFSWSTATLSGNGRLQMTNRTEVSIKSLAIDGNAKLALSSGASLYAPSATVNGQPLADGIHTSANGAKFIDGAGTLVVGNCEWTGAAGNGLWSDAGNWKEAITPWIAVCGADMSAASGMVTLDEAVTNSAFIYAPGTGATLTNSLSALLSFNDNATITVGTGDTLVLDGEVRIGTGYVKKRGEGTLVFAGTVSSLSTAIAPDSYIIVQEGKCAFESMLTNVSVRAGRYSQGTSAGEPEVVFGPESRMCGVSSINGNSAGLGDDPAPGNGTFTQNGGNIHPQSSWSAAVYLGMVSAATTTYHIVDGDFSLASGKNFHLSQNLSGSYGILTQDGGTSFIPSIYGAYGEINLNGGTMRVGSFTSVASVKFALAGGTLAPAAGTASVTPQCTLAGNVELNAEAGETMNFTYAPSGSGSFEKTGAGEVSFVAGLAASNDFTVTAGTVSMGASSAMGAVSVEEGAFLKLAGLSTATAFSCGSVEMEGGGALYTSNTCAFIKGEGALMVGGVPGKWNGRAGDGRWSSAANWSGEIIPSGGAFTADLSDATGTLSFDTAALTVGALAYAPATPGATLTNAAPEGGEANVLSIDNNGAITVAEGATLVLDHELCMAGGYASKRGGGTLVLRKGMRAAEGRATSSNYFSIEEGKVVNEGCITNVIPAPGIVTAEFSGETPEFVNRGPEAKVVGTTFVAASHMGYAAERKGDGIFTQDGGLVNPGIGWQIHGYFGYGDAGATGTYHLVDGVLRFNAGKTINFRYSSDGTGLFIQDGGVFEVYGGTGGTGGGVNMGADTDGCWMMNGGTCRVAKVTNPATIKFAGGVFNPLETMTFGSGFELLGDGLFLIDSGKTLTVSGANSFSGSASLVKEGPGTLAVSGTQATMTGDVFVNEGTLRLTGRLPSAKAYHVGAGATLEINCDSTASFAEDSEVFVDDGGRISLAGTGTAAIGSLYVNGVRRRGYGRLYGSSSHASAVDSVNDTVFSGTGVLSVAGAYSDGLKVILK